MLKSEASPSEESCSTLKPECAMIHVQLVGCEQSRLWSLTFHVEGNVLKIPAGLLCPGRKGTYMDIELEIGERKIDAREALGVVDCK
jgi:hypothetical protein